MLKKMVVICKALGQSLVSSLKRFPEAIFFAVLAALVLIILNHYDSSFQKETLDIFTRIAMIAALGIPLSLSVKVLFERASGINRIQKTIIYAVSLICLLLYYFLMLKDFEMVSIVRYIAFSVMLYAVFVFIPYFYKKESFELYVINLFIRFFITFLYAATLFIGLAAMLFAIDKLFSAGISGKVYLDLWLLAACVFAPTYFLSDLPKYGEELQVEGYSKILRVLLLYIVMPILLAYSLILYAYFAKIIITWQWPIGLVSNLVLWYAFISTLVIFFIYPLKGSNSWVRSYLMFFPKLILPLLIMMFISMGIRINAYGITESRYFVLVGGLWVFGCMAYFSLARNSRNINLVISIALIAALSVIGPWSCYSISQWSQSDRFEKILTRDNMLTNGLIIAGNSELPENDRKEISGILLYFSRNHHLSNLKYLPEGFTLDQMEKVFGYPLYEGNGPYNNGNQYFSHYISGENSLVDIKGYDYFWDFGLQKNINSEMANKSDYYANYDPNSRVIKIYEKDQVIYSKNIDKLAIKIHQGHENEDQLGINEMSAADQNDKVKVLFVFRYISGTKDMATGKINVDVPEFFLFAAINK